MDGQSPLGGGESLPVVSATTQPAKPVPPPMAAGSSAANASSNAPAGPTESSRRTQPPLRATTPLHIAVENIDVEALAASRAQVAIARLLMHYGGKLGDGDEEDDSQTPLHAAARCDAAMVHTLLLAGCNPNATDKLGLTPLHDAACEGRADAAKLLLEAGAFPAVGDRHGKTPLHYAAESGYIEVIDVLVEATAGMGTHAAAEYSVSPPVASPPGGGSSAIEVRGEVVIAEEVSTSAVHGETAGSRAPGLVGASATISTRTRAAGSISSATESEQEEDTEEEEEEEDEDDCCASSAAGSIPQDNNIDVCVRCGDYGELLICENCPRAFHLECLGLTSLPADDPWFCGECHVPLPPELAMLHNSMVVGHSAQSQDGTLSPHSTDQSDDNDSVEGGSSDVGHEDGVHPEDLADLEFATELAFASGAIHPALIEKLGSDLGVTDWRSLLHTLASELGLQLPPEVLAASQSAPSSDAGGDASIAIDAVQPVSPTAKAFLDGIASVAGQDTDWMSTIAKLALQQSQQVADSGGMPPKVSNILRAKFLKQKLQLAREARTAPSNRPSQAPAVASAIDVNGKDTNGRTPLYYAVIKGRMHAVKSLLAAGADMAAVTDDGKNLLHHAALHGQSSMITALVAMGLDSNSRDKTGQTPLYCAAEKGHLGATKALLLAGADVDAHDDGDNGVTPLRRAAACGHIPIIEALVNANATLDWASKTGNNALHDAAWNGRSDAIRALIAANASIHARDNHNWTALHYAADHGRAEAMQTLIELGADPNAKSRDRWTPLRLAAKGSHVEAVKVLLNAKAKFLMDDEEENYKQSPLHAAARLRDVSERNATVKTLIEAGADLSAKDKEGWTPVHCAAANGHADTLRALIAAGANVDAADNHGLSPLREAAAAGHTAAVQALIDAHADVNAKCKQGYTPLHDAAWQGRADAVKLLLAAGADARVKAIDGRSPLHCASQRGHKDVIALLVPHCRGDVSAHDRDGWTPMHKAAQEGHWEVVGALIAAGADVNAVHIYSSTPLHEAAAKGDTKTVGVLLDGRADVHAVDHLGQTPLHAAANNAKKNVGVVMQLLLHGASCFAKMQDGSTPLHVAAKAGNFDAVELLLRFGGDASARDSERRTASDVSQGAAVKKLLRLLKPSGVGSGTSGSQPATTSNSADIRSMIGRQTEYVDTLLAVTRPDPATVDAMESKKGKSKKNASDPAKPYLTPFDYKEIIEATEYFNPTKVAGKGMYGILFEGKLRGVDVVIKKVQIDPDAITATPAISLGAHLKAEVNLCHSMRELARLAALPSVSFDFGGDVPVASPVPSSIEGTSQDAGSELAVSKGSDEKKSDASPPAGFGLLSVVAARAEIVSALKAGLGKDLTSVMHNCRNLVGYSLLPRSISTVDAEKSALLLALVYAVPKYSFLSDWAFLDRQAVEVEVEMASQAAELAAQEAEKELLAADDKKTKKAKRTKQQVKAAPLPGAVEVDTAAISADDTPSILVPTAASSKNSAKAVAPTPAPSASAPAPVPSSPVAVRTSSKVAKSSSTKVAAPAATSVQVPRSLAEEEELLEAAIRESLGSAVEQTAAVADSWVPVAANRRGKKPNAPADQYPPPVPPGARKAGVAATSSSKLARATTPSPSATVAVATASAPPPKPSTNAPPAKPIKRTSSNAPAAEIPLQFVKVSMPSVPVAAQQPVVGRQVSSLGAPPLPQHSYATHVPAATPALTSPTKDRVRSEASISASTISAWSNELASDESMGSRLPFGTDAMAAILAAAAGLTNPTQTSQQNLLHPLHPASYAPMLSMTSPFSSTLSGVPVGSNYGHTRGSSSSQLDQQGFGPQYGTSYSVAQPFLPPHQESGGYEASDDYLPPIDAGYALSASADAFVPSGGLIGMHKDAFRAPSPASSFNAPSSTSHSNTSGLLFGGAMHSLSSLYPGRSHASSVPLLSASGDSPHTFGSLNLGIPSTRSHGSLNAHSLQENEEVVEDDTLHQLVTSILD